MNIAFLSHASLGTGFVVGSHQLAKSLTGKGHTVFHISSPVSILHLFLGKARRDKLFYALKNNRKLNPDFHFIDFIPVCLTPTGRSALLDRFNEWMIKRQIQSHIGKKEMDLVLIDQPTLYFALDLFDGATKVYRPTDLYSDMGGERFALPEKKALELVEGVVSTSSQVDSHIANLTNKPRLTMPNGVDYDLFAEIDASQSERKGCVYVGAVDFRFDLDMARYMAESNPNVLFDYYGPIAIDIVENSLPPNLNFKGPVAYNSIPALLNRYQYSIIPMNEHPANDGRSPMKLYEFLAAGLPVLCKRSQSITEEIEPAVMLYRDKDEAQRKFEFLTNQDLDGQVAEMKSIAFRHSWQSKADQILEFCQSLGGGR